MNREPQPPISVGVLLLRSGAEIPTRATAGATGLDIKACLDEMAEAMLVGPDPVLVPTGIAIEIPMGFDAQVRPRSGLTRRGVIVQLGTIDADYRGEVFVTMYTVGSREPHAVRTGDRIAQLVIAPLVASVLVPAIYFSVTERGSGGHGSTGD